MRKPISRAKLLRATEIRDAAVGLVARHGDMARVVFMDKYIEIAAFESDDISVLYKTPRQKLDCPWAPASANPKGFGVDIWSADRKTYSVQWNDDGPIDVLHFRRGD